MHPRYSILRINITPFEININIVYIQQMSDLITRIIPVFLIIFLGFIIYKKNIVSEEGFKTLKKLIMTVFLPSSLFFAFLGADLSRSHLLIPVGAFILCGLLYLIGFFLKKTGFLDSVYSAEFFTGFEFGMVGIALFSGIFGVKHLPVISLVGLGHEFFIWFIYFPLLNTHSPGHRSSFKTTVTSFFKSPIILSIILATVLNQAGASEFIYTNFIAGGFTTALEWLSSVTVSVVLIVLGSSLRFEKLDILKSIKFIISRSLFVAAAAFIFFKILSGFLEDLPVLFPYAVFTFFVLPPPYIIPIYVPDSQKEENIFMSNTIMLYTVMSLIIFVAALFIFPLA